MLLKDLANECNWPKYLFSKGDAEEELDLTGSHIYDNRFNVKHDIDGIFCLSDIGDIGILNLTHLGHFHFLKKVSPLRFISEKHYKGTFRTPLASQDLIIHMHLENCTSGEYSIVVKKVINLSQEEFAECARKCQDECL